MRILSIEPTPSPHSMKLNMDRELPRGKRMTFTKDNSPDAPEYITKLLDIPDVKSVFQTADFIALERFPKGNWEHILSEARKVFGEAAQAANSGETISGENGKGDSHFGDAAVLVQMFRGIPMQIRVRTELEEKREALPERFSKAVMRAQSASPNMIMERKLVDYGVRYWSLEEIAGQVQQELDASYSDERLEELIRLAEEQGSGEAPLKEKKEPLTAAQVMQKLTDPNWKVRYAALERWKPEEADIEVILKALGDENFSIRRLATVYLGDIGAPKGLEYLYQALKDKMPSVRRTAGDCLSDIGDPAAIPAMAEALRDPSKIVRWRAARFLYEIGDDSAVPALRAAQDDPEFEVQMQIRLALERIEGGHAAEGTVWQQMTRRNKGKNDASDG